MNRSTKQTPLGPLPVDWEVKTVAEVAKIKTGNKNTQDRIADGKYPFFVRSQQIERINSYSFDGEAVLTAGDGVGTGKIFHYINGRFDYHQRVYKMSDFADGVDGYFFYLVFSQHFYKRIMELTAKSSVDSVRMEMIADMLIPLPPLSEQRAIAGALGDIDAWIGAQEALITKKRDLKTATMAQLLTGQIRLAGFDGDWQTKTFPEVAWFQEGPGVRNTQFTSSGVKLLNGTNIFDGNIDLNSTSRYISEREAFGPYAHFLADAGDIVIACSGISMEKFHEKVAFVKESHLPLCMNTSTMRFKVNANELNASYLYQTLKGEDFKGQVAPQATGSAQLNFGPSHVKKVSIKLPPLDEQIAIAGILSGLDEELAALDAQLDKTRQLKAATMTALLSGAKRLV